MKKALLRTSYFVHRTSYLVHRTSSKSRGFTIIEVMVYGIVFSFILILVTQVFLTVNATSANSSSMSNLQQNYVRIFSDLEQTIRQASSVTSPTSKNSGASLSLNSGGIIYQLNAGVLEKVVSGSPISLSDNGVTISNLNFNNIGEATQAASIRVKMRIQSNFLFSGGRTLAEDFQTTINLR